MKWRARLSRVHKRRYLLPPRHAASSSHHLKLNVLHASSSSSEAAFQTQEKTTVNSSSRQVHRSVSTDEGLSSSSVEEVKTSHSDHKDAELTDSDELHLDCR